MSQLNPMSSILKMLALGMALSALLASCDDGNDIAVCYTCSVPPTEYSKGASSGSWDGEQGVWSTFDKRNQIAAE